MSLLDFHVELSLTNTLLARIADALDRLAPIPQPASSPKYKLVGLADVSRYDPSRSKAPAVNLNRHDFGSPGSAQAEQHTQAQASVTGAWDHEDPLDSLEATDIEWDNYAGVDGT